MKRLFNLKNLFTLFIVLGFLTINSNFVFADPVVSCTSHDQTACMSDSNCQWNGSSCITKTSTSTTSTTRGTGGLVPCVNDCTAEDLFGGNNVNTPPIWTSLIRTALGVSGIIILCIFVYGGVLIIVSRGKKEMIQKAQNIMKNSIIGLLIVIFAYTFVKFITIILTGSSWKLFFGGQ